MLKKLVALKNVGKFKNLNLSSETWNGVFEKVNIIYAQNGSGKTTFSLILESLSGNDTLLTKKKTFSSNDEILVRFIDDDNKEIKFFENKWNRHLKNIKVFNSHFIENNMYIIDVKSIDSHKIETGTQFLIGTPSLEVRQEIEELKSEEIRMMILRNEAKDSLSITNNTAEISNFRNIVTESNNNLRLLRQEIRKAKKKSFIVPQEFMGSYLSKVNEYLSIFNPDLALSEFKQAGNKIIYGLKVMDYEIRSEIETFYSLKYTLSEGDKNALALSFFLADIDLSQNIEDSIIVFDDPITSFDYSRKNATINFISKLSDKAKKVIVLTHDLYFARDLSKKVRQQVLNLKIIFNGISSSIVPHNIENESLSGIFKDLSILNHFIQNGADTDTELREVVRCIRPVIEGFLRLKYYGLIDEKEWLGDMIQKIRNSAEGNPFFNSKSQLDSICDLNDYSKEYHHSNPCYLEVPLNPTELRIYVNRTIDLLRKI